MERIDAAECPRPSTASPTGDPPARPSRRPRSSRDRVIVGFAFLLALGFLSLRSSRLPVLRPSVGERTQWAWRVTDLNGKVVDLSSYRGRAVFLNIWATWCPPCVAELPSIARLARDPRIQQANVEVLCIAVGESHKHVDQFIKSRPDDLSGPRVLVANDTPPSEFLTEAIPASYLIAPDGTIVESSLGMDEWDRADVVERVSALSRWNHPEAPRPPATAPEASKP